MRKLFITALIVLASFSMTLGQSQQGGSTQGKDDIPNMGRAPSEPNGIGRLDLRVEDENGHPVMSAFAKLESNRSDGYLCESWNTTDAKGVAVLPPIHMGKLTTEEMRRLNYEVDGNHRDKREVAREWIKKQ